MVMKLAAMMSAAAAWRQQQQWMQAGQLAAATAPDGLDH